MTELKSLWRPEFAAYMVEGTPGQPFGISPTPVERALKLATDQEDNNLYSVNKNIELDGGVEEHENIGKTSSKTIDNSKNCKNMFAFLNEIEANMRYRRQEVQSLLADDEACLSITVFPRSGTNDFCFPPAFVETVDVYSRSLFFPDQGYFYYCF